MKSRNWWKLLYLLPICACTVYAGGYVAQFIKNYQEWTAAGNFAGNGTYPKPASLHPLDCIHTILHYFPYKPVWDFSVSDCIWTDYLPADANGK